MLIRDWRERLHIRLLLAPATLVIVVLFIGGLVTGLAQSFGYMPLIGSFDLSLDAYVNVFTDNGFLRSLLLTFWVSLTSTGLATILAVVCALALRRDFPGKRLVMFVFQLNIPVPHLVGAIGTLFLLSQSGLMARVAYAIGAISGAGDFPALVYDKYGIAIIFEYLWKAVPFTGVIVLANLQSLGKDYENIARTLGANWWQRLRYVILPLIAPGLLRASIMVFAFTFGSFEVPFLLGQRFPSVLPVLAYRSYHDVDLNARPEAMAMSIVIAVLIGLLVLGYMKLMETQVRSEN